MDWEQFSKLSRRMRDDSRLRLGQLEEQQHQIEDIEGGEWSGTKEAENVFDYYPLVDSVISSEEGVISSEATSVIRDTGNRGSFLGWDGNTTGKVNNTTESSSFIGSTGSTENGEGNNKALEEDVVRDRPIWELAFRLFLVMLTQLFAYVYRRRRRIGEDETDSADKGFDINRSLRGGPVISQNRVLAGAIHDKNDVLILSKEHQGSYNKAANYSNEKSSSSSSSSSTSSTRYLETTNTNTPVINSAIAAKPVGSYSEETYSNYYISENYSIGRVDSRRERVGQSGRIAESKTKSQCSSYRCSRRFRDETARTGVTKSRGIFSSFVKTAMLSLAFFSSVIDAFVLVSNKGEITMLGPIDIDPMGQFTDNKVGYGFWKGDVLLLWIWNGKGGFGKTGFLGRIGSFWERMLWKRERILIYFKRLKVDCCM